MSPTQSRSVRSTTWSAPADRRAAAVAARCSATAARVALAQPRSPVPHLRRRGRTPGRARVSSPTSGSVASRAVDDLHRDRRRAGRRAGAAARPSRGARPASRQQVRHDHPQPGPAVLAVPAARAPPRGRSRPGPGAVRGAASSSRSRARAAARPGRGGGLRGAGPAEQAHAEPVAGPVGERARPRPRPRRRGRASPSRRCRSPCSPSRPPAPSVSSSGSAMRRAHVRARRSGRVTFQSMRRTSSWPGR